MDGAWWGSQHLPSETRLHSCQNVVLQVARRRGKAGQGSSLSLPCAHMPAANGRTKQCCLENSENRGAAGTTFALDPQWNCKAMLHLDGQQEPLGFQPADRQPRWQRPRGKLPPLRPQVPGRGEGEGKGGKHVWSVTAIGKKHSHCFLASSAPLAGRHRNVQAEGMPAAPEATQTAGRQAVHAKQHNSVERSRHAEQA